nr:PREDICTED: probable G-protein coupled receptor 114 [Equus przewalskii]
MERRGALFLGLCLVTVGSRTADASGESLRWMQRMEAAARSRRPTSPPEFIHGLEQRLLNATFGGHNLTLQTRTIQSLAFRLGCDFAGLSLSSSIMEWVPQTRHTMQFPAELTQNACRARPRELRLICIYFLATYYFQVSALAAEEGGRWPLPGATAGIHATARPLGAGQHHTGPAGFRLELWTTGPGGSEQSLPPVPCPVHFCCGSPWDPQPAHPWGLLTNAEPLSHSSGVPAFLVLLVLAVKSSAYGPRTILLSDSQGNGTSFQNMSMCWVRSPEVHSVLVMGYGGLTSLFNLVVLAWALRALRRLKAREKAPGPRACRDTVTVLGLTVLLGTTWALAFFSFGVFLLPQLFLFTVFNSLYGFFLFLWFCSRRCRSEAVAEAEMEAFSSAQTVS